MAGLLKRRRRLIAMIVLVGIAAATAYLWSEGYLNAWFRAEPDSVPLDLGEPPPE